MIHILLLFVQRVLSNIVFYLPLLCFSERRWHYPVLMPLYLYFFTTFFLVSVYFWYSQHKSIIVSYTCVLLTECVKYLFNPKPVCLKWRTSSGPNIASQTVYTIVLILKIFCWLQRVQLGFFCVVWVLTLLRANNISLYLKAISKPNIVAWNSNKV